MRRWLPRGFQRFVQKRTGNPYTGNVQDTGPVQGALYFPLIRVPDTAWWTRTMLYWDNVATIVPREFIGNPQLHRPYTLQLIRAGLLHQVFPDDAGSGLAIHFEAYLHR